MKSLPASLSLAATAIIHAMAFYTLTGSSAAVSGQVFFPILFALMAVYLAWRNKDGERYGIVHVALAVLGVAAFVATMVGKYATIYWLYPSFVVYYVAFGLLVVELFFRVLALPKKPRTRDAEGTEESEDAAAPAARRPGRRRRRVPGQGPTNLVARPKSAEPESTESETAGSGSARTEDEARKDSADRA